MIKFSRHILEFSALFGAALSTGKEIIERQIREGDKIWMLSIYNTAFKVTYLFPPGGVFVAGLQPLFLSQKMELLLWQFRKRQVYLRLFSKISCTVPPYCRKAPYKNGEPRKVQ